MSSKDLNLKNVGTALTAPFGVGLYEPARKALKRLGAQGQMPELPEPLAMPLPDEEAIMAARRRSIVQQVKRRGRASTILSQPERLG